MTTETDTWVPEKSDYTDEEIKATPVFQRIRSGVSVQTGGKTINLPDDSILPLARDAIKEMWETLQSSRFSDSISGVFAALDAAGVDHGNEVLIRRNEEGVCSHKRTKTGGRKRFSHEGYARLIGYGEDTEKSEVYKQALEKLRKAGYDPLKVLHGGFLITKNQMKNPNKNGVFELVIEAGVKGNKLCEAFTARLYQFPDAKQAVPVITFPPESGDKGKLKVNDAVLEVASMSQMMKNSIIQGAQTPAVQFGLVEHLKALGEDVSGLEEDGEEDADADAASDEEAPAPTAAKAPAAPAKGAAAPAPGKKGGAARNVLSE